MNKVKLRLITIISLLVLFALVLGVAIGTVLPVKKAFAATTYAPTTIFSEGTSGGTVGASEADEGETSYVQFTLSNGDKVHYRRDLALKWFAAAVKDADDGDAEGGSEEENAPSCTTEYFSMTLAFIKPAFEKFTLTFESVEENISKDGKATNAIEFALVDGVLKAGIVNAENKDEDVSYTTLEGVDPEGDLKITLDEEECTGGEFAVYCNGIYIGKFTNVGGNFMEYRSSTSSTPITPITFEAQLASGEDAVSEQKVLMKELNRQTFGLEDKRVVDNASPVLVLDEKVYAFTLGQRFSLTYEAIDVCDSSVTVTRSYYMAKKDENGAWVKPDESASSSETNAYKTLTTSTYFLPPDDNSEEECEYVSIRFKLDDGTTDAIFVYLSWYAVDDAVKDLDGYDYIAVDREKKGPSYAGIVADEAAAENVFEENGEGVRKIDALVEDYQNTLIRAAETASAGSGSYIYLPSLRELFTSDYADYRNLKFSIYYFKESQAAGATASSQTTLKYNALKLEIDEAGKYKFRVLATDAAGNGIQLYQDGELVTVTSSNIWDIDGIPEFTFDVKYDGATIEDCEEQSLGYRNDTYTFDDFEVIALKGYTTDYTLYRFDTSKLPQGVSSPTYSSFVENAKTYAEETYKDCLVEINEFNDEIDEDDAAWDRTDNDYYWKPSSGLSFQPQEAAFYVLKLVVTDAQLPGHTATGYQVIEVRNPIDTIPGQSQWLKNNVASVVLFSISAVLAVIIVILLVVKPSDKKVEEVDLSKLKGQNKKKK